MKRHYIPVTAAVPGVNDSQRAFIRKVIRTALAAEGVDFPCEVDVLVTNDAEIRELNREARQVDKATDVLSFPAFDLEPGELPGPEDADPGTGLVPLGDMMISLEHVTAQAKELRPCGRGPDEGADAGAGGGHPGGAGDYTVISAGGNRTGPAPCEGPGGRRGPQ